MDPDLKLAGAHTTTPMPGVNQKLKEVAVEMLGKLDARALLEKTGRQDAVATTGMHMVDSDGDLDFGLLVVITTRRRNDGKPVGISRMELITAAANAFVTALGVRGLAVCDVAGIFHRAMHDVDAQSCDIKDLADHDAGRTVPGAKHAGPSAAP